MHEFSIAESLVKAVEDELRIHNYRADRLKTVRVRVGEMRQVVPDTLKFAYQTLVGETTAASSSLEIEFQATEALCRDCKWQGPVYDHLFVCPQCDSTDLEITAGRDLALISMEFDEDE